MNTLYREDEFNKLVDKANKSKKQNEEKYKKVKSFIKKLASYVKCQKELEFIKHYPEYKPLYCKKTIIKVLFVLLGLPLILYWFILDAIVWFGSVKCFILSLCLFPVLFILVYNIRELYNKADKQFQELMDSKADTIKYSDEVDLMEKSLKHYTDTYNKLVEQV